MKPGNVPTAKVGPILGDLIRDRWPHGNGVDVLAEKAGCDWTAIEGIVKGVHEGVSFDLIDKLFCCLGRVDLWQGVLKDVYDSVVFVQTCNLHSCSKTFPESKPRNQLQRYCSPACRSLAQKVRRGEKPGDRFQQRGKFRCGHKMTPENSVPVKTAVGLKRTCRTCRRQKQIQWQRDYRARKRLKAAA